MRIQQSLVCPLDLDLWELSWVALTRTIDVVYNINHSIKSINLTVCVLSWNLFFPILRKLGFFPFFFEKLKINKNIMNLCWVTQREFLIFSIEWYTWVSQTTNKLPTYLRFILLVFFDHSWLLVTWFISNFILHDLFSYWFKL